MKPELWTPADLLQLSGGYWSVCTLQAGVVLDVFTPLAVRCYTADELAGQINADRRGLSTLLNALCSMGLLRKDDDVYAATSFSAAHLSRNSDRYLGHIILHHHHLMESWSRLDEGVKRGGAVAPRVSHCDDESARESFLMGMFNLAMQLAPRIVPSIDLAGRSRLLDLGGGPGTYAIHFCLHNRSLQAVIFDLETTRRFADETVSRFGVSDRISFHAGDFINDPLPQGFDVAWLSHVLHSEGPEGCVLVLSKAVQALTPGGMILIQEFILDDTLDGPEFPALFSLNMLLGTPSGQAYSGGQLAEFLQQAGAVNINRLDIGLPNGAGIISAEKPA